MKRILLPLNLVGCSFISVSIPLRALTVYAGSKTNPVPAATLCIKPAHDQSEILNVKGVHSYMHAHNVMLTELIMT